MSPASKLLAVLVFCSGAADAQELLWAREGKPPPGANFLGEVAVLEDVDGDGYDDLVQVVSGLGIWILSGKDGMTLRVKTDQHLAVMKLVGAGDMDGDGRGDYAIGLSTGRVEVRSAWDDRVLWQVYASGAGFGLAILGSLDVDGDRRPDLVVGAFQENNRLGAIYVYSNSGALLYRLTALPNLNSIGWTLAKVGDVDADGCDDFVSGAFETVANVGVAVLFSGRTGKVLTIGYGDPDGVLGASVTGCGDLDGDGVPDFAASTGGNFGQRGLVRAFSGRTGGALFTWVSPTVTQYGNSFGYAIASEVDLDRDGVSEVLIAAPPSSSGTGDFALLIYSGRDGSRISYVAGRIWASNTTLRPQPGSPFPVFAARGQASVPEIGRVMMYRGAATGVQAFGASCRGTLASDPRIGIRDVGGTSTRLHLSGAPPGSPAALVLGLSRTSYAGIPLPMPLQPFGFPGCLLYTSPDLFLMTNTGSAGVARGYAFVDVPIPLATPGTFTLYGQWLSFGSGPTWPGGVTEALLWRH
jgi:hypothetical protein